MNPLFLPLGVKSSRPTPLLVGFVDLVLTYALAASSLGFLAMGYDKLMALWRGWRVPEATLLTIALLGGAFGVSLGMLVFRHKIRKTGFASAVLFSLLLNALILLALD